MTAGGAVTLYLRDDSVRCGRERIANAAELRVYLGRVQV